MKVLITGGAGFVGYHLAELLSQNQNLQIYIIDDLSRGKIDNNFSKLLKKNNVFFFKKDIKKPDVLKKLSEKNFNYIFHCAAVCGTRLFYEKPYYTLLNNLQTTINLIEFFKNFKGKLLFTSTSEVYSGNENLPLPTPEVVRTSIADVFNPRWSYAGSKIVGEQLFIHGAKKYGFRYSIVRFHNIYGERMGYEHVIPGVIKRIFEKQSPFEIFGKNETRSFCYIKDGMEALWKVAASNKTDSKIINIGRSEETKIGDIYKEIFKLADFRPKKVIYKDSPKGSTKRRYPDVELLKKLTGYECKTDIKKGVKKTFDWYKKDLEKL
ncbi:MAG: NAD(P)-dependent oxidoreductase [Minisyncoccales bacterium]